MLRRGNMWKRKLYYLMAVLLVLSNIYLFQLYSRDGFVPVPKDTPIPSIRIDRERNSINTAETSFSFAVLGDMRWESSPRIATLIYAEMTKPLFMVNLGDAVRYARLEEWKRYVSELAAHWDRSIPYYHIPGGHSLNLRVDGVYPAFYGHYFGKTNYLVDVGKWRFIFLDTSKTYLTGRQTEWLSDLLEECKEGGRRAVIFTHCPPMSSEQGVTHSLTRGSTERLGEIISGYDVAAIFAGHIHRNFSYKWGPRSMSPL